MGNANVPAGVFPVHSDEVENTYRKVALRIVPLTVVAYIIAYIDRVNVGFAKLQFMQDLGFSEAVYGLGAGLFFIGYMLFEIPSNLYLEKVGARLTLARIMILWGLISAGMAFVSSPVQFYVMRFLLGAAEAGFFPGIILYLSYWFPSERRARITSFFTMGGAVAGIIGSPLSGWLLTLDGLHGLRGWQVVFIYEGIPAVALGVFAYLYMDDKPQKVKWLSTREKDIVVNNLQADRQTVDSADHSTLRQAFRDPIVYVLAIAYIAVIAGTSTVALWAPTVLRGLGVAPSMIGILTGAPFILAVAAMYLLGLSSDRMLERRWHYAGAISAAGASLILLGLGTGNVTLTVALIAVAAAGAWASLPVFWTIPPAYLSGTARAGGIAFISSVGAIGGFISPTIVGGITSLTGSLYYGLAGVGAMLILSAVILLLGIQSKTIHERKVELQSATA